MIPQLTGSVIREQVCSKGDTLRAAFETNDKIRRTCTQWLVNSSRRVCDLFRQPDWTDPAKRVKAESCLEEITDRSFKIWHFDSGKMVEDTIQDYREKTGEGVRTKTVDGKVAGDGSNESEWLFAAWYRQYMLFRVFLIVLAG